MPRFIPEQVNDNTLTEEEKDLWRLVGLYIGDGTRNTTSLSNIDPDIINDYTNIVKKYFNCDIRVWKEQLSAIRDEETRQKDNCIFNYDKNQLEYLFLELKLSLDQLCKLYETSPETMKKQLILNNIVSKDYNFRKHSTPQRVHKKNIELPKDITIIKNKVSLNPLKTFLNQFEFYQLYSKERYLPANLTLPQLSQVLAGIFLTDGTVVDVNKKKCCNLAYSTSSYRLALDIQASLSRFAIKSSLYFSNKKKNDTEVYDKNYQVVIHGLNNAQLFLKHIPIYGIKKQKLLNAINVISSNNKKINYLGDLQELKIKSIVKEDNKVDVYDVSVANSNYLERNFLANGLIVHNCVDLAYCRKLGVDTSEEKFLLIQPDSGVQALTVMEEFCEAGVCSVVILDSIASLRTEQEVNGDVGDQHMAVLARLLSAPMKNLTSSAKKTNTAILFINQVRAGIGIYGAPDVTPGGNSVKFYPSLRISVARKDWIKKGEEPIGQVIRARTIKNRMNNPYKVEEISLIFGEGIDQVIEAVDVAVEKGIIVRGGAWFNLVSSTGEELKFQGRDSVYDFYRNSKEDFEFLKSKLFTPNTKVIETPEEESFEDLDE